MVDLREFRNRFDKNRGLVTSPAGWRHAGETLLRRLRAPRRRPDRPLCVLATHHKAMTTFFTASLRTFCFAEGLRFDARPRGLPAPDEADIALNFTSHFDFDRLDRVRCVKVVRDPRDLVVSGYHYHLWTTEPWANKRHDGNPSLREKLNAMSKSEGLMYEITRFSRRYAVLLREWHERRDQALILRYEDLMGPDRAALYPRIFDYWGFDDEARDFGVRTMKLFEFESRTGRKIGEAREGSHLRSGAGGGWRAELDRDHLAAVEALFGDVIRAYGYAPADS